jgi:pseudaminic acid synthase
MKFKKPFFIAEISANHGGSFSDAKKLILLAKKNGADAVKLQTYTADTMTLKSKKSPFIVKEGLWKGYNLWDLYDKAHTPFSWHKNLFEYAKKINIKIFSSPFDSTAIELLEKLNCPFYKVASFEMTDYPLIKKLAKTKKTLIISTGLSDLKEIEFTYRYAKKHGAGEIILLYCVSKYPSEISDFNLNNIRILKKKFNCTVGFSDHSKNDDIAYAAIAAGAEIIEKHISLKNKYTALDYDFSLKGSEIKKFRKKIDEAYKLLGKDFFYREKKELKNKLHRRSIFATKKILKGEKFSKSNIKVLRPGIGISSYYYESLLGKKSPKEIEYAEPFKLDILKRLKLKIIKN